MEERELPFEAKIEQIIRHPAISEMSVSEIVDKIYISGGHTLFFSKIRESQTHGRLFFLHRFDLFGVDSEIHLPYFYLTNIPKRGRSEEKVPESRALQHVVSREVIALDGKDFLFSFLGIPESRATKFGDDFKDILAYFTISFIRSNEDLIHLINTKEFNYKIMKSILKDYENISFDNVGKELSGAFKGEEWEIDPVIRSKIEKISFQVVSGVTRNITHVIESSRKMIPNIMLSFHVSSGLWLSTILTKTHLTIDDYVNILNDLYINKLIENKSTIFWCENCSLESPSYDEHHGRIAPSKITKNKCLNCNRTQSYSSLFLPDDLLREAIFSKDGFLSVYFGWLLKKEAILFNVGEYSSDYENDFVINNNTLVECKMFKSEKDKIAIKSELENSLVQIRNHLDSLNKDEKRIKYVYLIWNRYENPKESIDRVKTKYSELFENYDFKVFGPEDIDGLISQLKKRGTL
jgi:hypothetical protein